MVVAASFGGPTLAFNLDESGPDPVIDAAAPGVNLQPSAPNYSARTINHKPNP